MRRSLVTTAALAFAAVLAQIGPAFADGSSASPSPQAPSAVPTSMAPSTEALPAPVPSASASQVVAVPKGAPDTGVAPVASSGVNAVALSGELGGAVVLVGAGAYGLRRRSKALG